MSGKLYISILSICLSISSFNAWAYGDDGYGTLPIVSVNGDMSNVLINQGVSPDSSSTEISISVADPSSGFRQVHSDSVDLKAGVYGGWYEYNGHYYNSPGVGAAIIPVVGSAVVVDRFLKKESEAKTLPKVLIPARSKALDSWRPHDSLYYYNRGGVIFSVGAGYLFTGLSGDFFVAGEVEMDGEPVVGHLVVPLVRLHTG